MTQTKGVLNHSVVNPTQLRSWIFLRSSLELLRRKVDRAFQEWCGEIEPQAPGWSAIEWIVEKCTFQAKKYQKHVKNDIKQDKYYKKALKSVKTEIKKQQG